MAETTTRRCKSQLEAFNSWEVNHLKCWHDFLIYDLYRRTFLDRIHRRLVSGFEPSHSAILFPTGESGSGKTVTTVLSIDYFISREYSSIQSKLESALAILHGKTDKPLCQVLCANLMFLSTLSSFRER
jgi:hypothetical protein